MLNVGVMSKQKQGDMMAPCQLHPPTQLVLDSASRISVIAARAALESDVSKFITAPGWKTQ